jgi:hypothetical protein
MRINEIIDFKSISPGKISNIPPRKKFVALTKFIQNNCSEILNIYKSTRKIVSWY